MATPPPLMFALSLLKSVYESRFLSDLSLNHVSAMQMTCGELCDATTDLNSSHLLTSDVGLVYMQLIYALTCVSTLDAKARLRGCRCGRAERAGWLRAALGGE